MDETPLKEYEQIIQLIEEHKQRYEQEYALLLERKNKEHALLIKQRDKALDTMYKCNTCGAILFVRNIKAHEISRKHIIAKVKGQNSGKS